MNVNCLSCKGRFNLNPVQVELVSDVTQLIKSRASNLFFLLLFRRKKKQKLVKNAHFKLFTFR